VSPTVTNADTWIDEELASLRQSVDLPGELASTDPRAAPPPRRRARRAPMPRLTIVGRVQRELHARRFDIVFFFAAAFGSLALGLLIPLLLQ
jgi:hypothetical protein